MHPHFALEAAQILWTLMFAAQLVLLVVLLGRDRARRFPWFTAAIALAALKLLASRLLFGRIPQLTMNEIFLALMDVSAIIGVLVLVEMARRSFSRAPGRVWIIWTTMLLAIGGVVVALWGRWPAWKTLIPTTAMADLGLMQLFAQKVTLLVDVLTVLLGLLVVLFGRRYGAGWRSHAQRILIGLSTVALAEIAVQAIWQLIATHTTPHSMAEYQRALNLRERLYNGNSAINIAAAIWWIVCLWIEEPGKTSEKPAATLEGPGSEVPAQVQSPGPGGTESVRP